MVGKRVVWGVVALALVIGAGVAGVQWALGRAPEFYEVALRELPPPEVRKQQAKRFVQTTLQLVDQIRHEERWSEEFTEEQINAFLAEEVPVRYAQWLPAGMQHPRVHLGDNVLEAACRYHQGRWRGVCSIRLRMWVPAPRQVAVEVQSLRVGLVPVPLDEVLGTISDQLEAELRDYGWQAEWKQSAGQEVLLLTSLSKKTETPVLEELQLTPGVLRISGSRPETSLETMTDEKPENPSDTQTERVATADETSCSAETGSPRAPRDAALGGSGEN